MHERGAAMLESLKIIFEESLSVYRLGTLDGRLFIPFVLCCAYLLLSPAEEDERARYYFVYPSLILCVFIFNPVFIHYMVKYMGDPERVVRVFWPLPIGGVIVYCVIRAFFAVKKRWKRVCVLLAAVCTLLLVTEGSHAGISFVPASNPQKLVTGAKELCDKLYVLSDGEETRVLVPKHLFFWIREYNAAIITPYSHKAEFMYGEDGMLDFDETGRKAREAQCDYVVIPAAAPPEGALDEYGYTLLTETPGDDCVYYIFCRTGG